MTKKCSFLQNFRFTLFYFQKEIETLQTRTQEFQEFGNDLEIHMAEIQNETKEHLAKSSTASEGREKLLEAKIEDLSDRLRLGMGKLQQAIGESSASVGKLAAVDVRNFRYFSLQSCKR